MQDIVIWGTGVIARSFYYKLYRRNFIRGGVRVRYFLDNSPVNHFYGHEVFRPTKENCSQYLIVIASSIYYEEIAIQLTEYGLEELKNFIPWQALGKNVLLMHGNCHIGIIRAYLNTSESFREKYYIYPITMIQNNKKGYIKDSLLANCDGFIYQDIQPNNQYDVRLSAEYLIPKVNGIKICIPNVFGMGKIFYPQAKEGREDSLWHNPQGKELPGGLFNYRDENIDHLWKKGIREIEEIVKFLKKDVYDKEYIRNNCERYFDKMKQREEFWDVKILAYIKQNYKNQQMFYEPAHPCNNILRKVSEGILQILKIDSDEIDEIEESFGVSEMPVYECVKEALGLKFERKVIRNCYNSTSYKLTEENMDLEEYVREYCYWCFDELK